MQDKWAEWTDNQSPSIPSNIKGKIVTILIEKTKVLLKTNLEPNYEFERSKDKYVKGDL